MALIAVGVDITLNYQALGGYRWIIHNPGSTFFHLGVFPALLGLTLFLACRGAVLMEGPHDILRATVAIPFLLLIAGVAFTKDTEQMEKARLIEPADFDDRDIRRAALALDEDLRGLERSEFTKGVDLRHWSEGHEASEGDAAAKSRAGIQPEDKAGAYRRFIDGLTPSGGFSLAVDGGPCAWSGRALSALASVSGFLLVVSTVLLGIQRARMRPYFREFAICVIGFGAWIPMRIYSETYAHYGAFDIQTYQALFVVATATVVVGALVLTLSDGRPIAKLIGASIHVGLLLIVSAISGDGAHLVKMLEFSQKIDNSTLMIMQLLLAFGAFMCISLILGDEHVQTDPPDANTST